MTCFVCLSSHVLILEKENLLDDELSDVDWLGRLPIYEEQVRDVRDGCLMK